MANPGRLPRFQPGRLGPARVPAPLASLGGHIPRGIRWRLGSKIAQVDALLRARPYHWKLGPTHVARLMTFALNRPVYKAEVLKVLKDWNHTRKKISIVPARSRPNERFRHLNALWALWARDDMFVFVDEKTWHRGEVKERVNEFGYSERGHRVPLRFPFEPFIQALPPCTGIIGALGVVAPSPMLSGGVGDVGLFSFMYVPGRRLAAIDVVRYFEVHLAPRLNPFPGPRSVVVLDNAPIHRRALGLNAQARIRAAVQRRGALLIWNPPHSPDLNPIEHIWSVSKAWSARRLIDLMLGRVGVPRPFAMGDLTWCLQNARLSRAAFHAIFQQPY